MEKRKRLRLHYSNREIGQGNAGCLGLLCLAAFACLVGYSLASAEVAKFENAQGGSVPSQSAVNPEFTFSLGDYSVPNFP